ncbi:MAG: hypothetical protein A2114_02385 [Candidatus Vogelbacteria bacterium GWA1_51_14]|uniref:Uncharacterized protein n=1 Tax=Candidatus Vogelbacteria bacterium GWA1_51_14 TaxID=1802435 RepID=A0A1G2QAU2_9BACT|nr:MAG: hypothetical protein A2114_02385 [Candidatus Vogelbacteria bacterium GWA1_51_14]
MSLKNCFLPPTTAVLLIGCGGQPAGDFVVPDPDALADYWRWIKSASSPTGGREERLVARALDLAEQSGYFIRAGEEVEITGHGGVPVAIKVDGHEVIITEDLYTIEEKIMIRAAESVAASLASTLN